MCSDHCLFRTFLEPSPQIPARTHAIPYQRFKPCAQRRSQLAYKQTSLHVNKPSKSSRSWTMSIPKPTLCVFVKILILLRTRGRGQSLPLPGRYAHTKARTPKRSCRYRATESKLTRSRYSTHLAASTASSYLSSLQPTHTGP